MIIHVDIRKGIEVIQVYWLLAGIYSNSEELYNSMLASTRMRAGLVARYSNENAISFSFGELPSPDSDVIVVGKIGSDCKKGRSSQWLDQLGKAKDRGQRIILDYTDHHLAIAESPMREFYEGAIRLADVVVVPSDHMRSLVAAMFDGRIVVIEDAIEVPILRSRRPTLETRPVLLWFGHASNVSYLIDFMENFALCDTTFSLKALSNRQSYEIFASRNPKVRPGIEIEFKQWSLDGMIKDSQACHACLIPSDPSDVRKVGASSNRLLTSLALGLPTSASPIPSYREFSAYFHDIESASLASFLDMSNHYQNSAAEAQNDVLPRFEPKTVAKRWKDLFVECMS